MARFPHAVRSRFEMQLLEMEDFLSRPGRKSVRVLPSLRNHLISLLSEMAHRYPAPAEMRHNLRLLQRRVDSCRTVEEIQGALRDARQLLLTMTSSMQAAGLEERIHDLEGQLKSVVDTALSQIPPLEDKAVTIESLKDKRVLFAIMPFQEGFQDVWLGGIQRAANGTGLTPLRIDSITTSSEITDDIVAAIQLAELVVVDVTQNNPNVMFEFGFALALRKPHIVISQSTEYLTFDIKNLRTLIYTNSWRGIEELHKDLQKYIKGTVVVKKSKVKKATEQKA